MGIITDVVAPYVWNSWGDPITVFTATFPGIFYRRGPGDPVTAYTSTGLDSNGGGAAGASFRMVSATLSTGGLQIRISVTADTASTGTVANFGIGVLSSGGATVATPVELLVGGAHGKVISAGVDFTTDWADLVTTSSDKIVAIADQTSGSMRYGALMGNFTAAYFKLLTASYNSSSDSGFTSGANPYFLKSVEVRNRA